MNLDALAVFHAVAEAESFSEASRRLGVPKSSVSRQVAALEARLQAKLFHRTTRRVSLTPRGRELLERVAPHVTALARVSQGDLADEPAGTLRLTSTPDIAAAVLADVVARFMEQHPGVAVEVDATIDMVDMVATGTDVALRIATADLPDSPHLRASRVGRVSLQLYASPRYLARAGTPTSLGALDAHRLIGFPRAAPLMRHLPDVVLRTNDTFFLHRAAIAGAGIAALPTFLVRDDLIHGDLVPVIPSWTSWTGSVWMVTPYARDLPSRVERFKALLQESLDRTGVLSEGAD